MGRPPKPNGILIKSGDKFDILRTLLQKAVKISWELTDPNVEYLCIQLLEKTNDNPNNWNVEVVGHQIKFIISNFKLHKIICATNENKRRESESTSIQNGSIPLTSLLPSETVINENENESYEVDELPNAPEDDVDDPIVDPDFPIPTEELLRTTKDHKWELVGNDVFEIKNMYGTRGPTKFIWSNLDLAQFGRKAYKLQEECTSSTPTFRPISCFLLAFPVQKIAGIVKRTNENLRNAGESVRLTSRKLLELIGMNFMVCLEKRKSFYSFFKQEKWEREFGSIMSASEHQTLLKHISWSQIDEQDSFSKYSGFLNGLNDRKYATIIVGSNVTLDESMCKWVTFRTGVNGFSEVYIRNITLQPRKPIKSGTEIRNVVDVDSNVILRLEIVKAKEDSLNDKYRQTYGPSTASVLRLVEPWKNSGITVIADSYFSSVRTVKACRDMGFYFIGTIKKGHGNFPIKYFNYLSTQTPAPAQCESRFLKTEVKTDSFSYPILAACWYNDEKMFISSIGDTSIGEHTYSQPYIPNANNNLQNPEERKVSMPKIGKNYYDCFNKVDIHNHLRQGSLAMEESIHTKNWVYRLICCTIGMIAVDAYYIYKYMNKQQTDTLSSSKLLTFREFMVILTNELITNEFEDDIATRYKRNRYSFESCGSTSTTSFPCELSSLSLKYPDKVFANGSYRRSCSICPNGNKKKATGYCVPCSNYYQKDVVVCRGSCFDKHVKERGTTF
jgi:Transposase IS4